MSVDREFRRQQLLVHTLWRDTGPEALAAHTSDGPFFHRGLQAYQAHAGALAERALAAVFPTVQQLLGPAPFGALARVFWRFSPPTSGDLGAWGAGLPAVVAAAPDLAGEPYLGDVAQLEWAVHRASTAADRTPAPWGLQHLAQGDPMLLRLLPRAGTALVHSPHPIVSIWQAHRRPGVVGGLVDEPEQDVAESSASESANESAIESSNERFAAVREALAHQRAEPALVWRQGWQVQVAALSTAEAFFTQHVLQGDALGVALHARALAAPVGGEPVFDFQHWLLLQLQRGWLAGVA